MGETSSGVIKVSTGSTEPDIDVSGNGFSFTNGRTDIRTSDYTNFGAAYVSGAPMTVVRTFAIFNYGLSVLTV